MLGDFFRFCPVCGKEKPCIDSEKQRTCQACGQTWFINPGTAVGVFLERDNGAFLLLRRAHDPKKGLLALPGGFVDIGESAEEALRREIFEETDIECDDFDFVCSTPNCYEYRSVTYATTDLFFRAHLPAGAEPSINEESTDFLWVTPDAFDPALLAFDSVKAAYPCYLDHRKAAVLG